MPILTPALLPTKNGDMRKVGSSTVIELKKESPRTPLRGITSVFLRASDHMIFAHVNAALSLFEKIRESKLKSYPASHSLWNGVQLRSEL